MKDYEGIKYTKGASVFFVTGPSTFLLHAMLPYRPRTVQRCVRHVFCWVSRSSRSWRSDSTVRSKSRSHPCTPATPQRRRPTRARSNTPEKETQNRIDFPRPASMACLPCVVSQSGEGTGSNQQAKRLFMQFAVKCEGNHSRWHVGNGTTRWAATCYKWSHGALINGRKYMDGRGQKRGRWLSSDKPSGLLGDIWC